MQVISAQQAKNLFGNLPVVFPAHGQHKTSNDLCKQGVFISGSGARSIGLHHNLENVKKRLKALEEKVARDGIELTDSQIAVLERKASDDEACGEIETVHPGYLGAQDTHAESDLTKSAIRQCHFFRRFDRHGTKFGHPIVGNARNGS